MIPIIITTPLSGANHFCNVFVNLLKQWHNCNGYVHSLITQEPWKKSEITYIDGTIKYFCEPQLRNILPGLQPDEPLLPKNITDLGKNIQYLITSPNHLVKLYPGHMFNYSCITSLIDEFNYKPIYFERRNKLHQVIMSSFLTERNEDSSIDKLIYIPGAADSVLISLHKLKKYKKHINAKTIYYEDFIQLGHNEKAVIELLDLDKKHYTTTVYDDFNYCSLTEDVIINKALWMQHRDTILAQLSELD